MAVPRWVKAMVPKNRTSRSWLSRVKNAYDLGRLYDADTAAAGLALRAPPAFLPVDGRLCYVLSSSPPQVSGYSTRSQGMAGGLRDAGFDLVALTRPGYPWDRTAGQPHDDCDRVDGIDYHRIRAPLQGSLPQRDYVAASIGAYRAALSRIRPMAVLAASNWETALPAGIAARSLGLPFFYEVRGFWEMTRAAEEAGFEATALYAGLARLEAVTAMGADHVFTLTAAMRAELIRRGVAPACVTVLPNRSAGAGMQSASGDADLRATLGLPAGVPVIGYVGSFLRYEGLDLLIEACGRLAREGLAFRLLMVGAEAGGPGRYTAELAALAARHGIADRISMPGRTPHDQVGRYYQLIDIAAFPRRSHLVTETVSPLKPAEAMAMGKAVILSDVGGMAGIVDHGATGWIVAKDSTDSLADGLRHLLQSPAVRADLAAGAGPAARRGGWPQNGRDLRAIVLAHHRATAARGGDHPRPPASDAGAP